MIKLSIIIVNYKVPYFLEQCLLSVKTACKNINAEIIVIDNNSADESCEIIRKKFTKVKLIENKTNIGFARANNQGVFESKGEFILILNPDIVIAEDSLDKVLLFAEKQQKMGALGIKFIDGTGNFLPECKRNIPTLKIANQKIRGNTKKYYANHISENEIAQVEILTGAFMLMKREVYLKIGGFDEDYFMYGEDIDISYKALKKGYQNYYYPNTQIIHYKGESTSKNAKYLGNFYGAMRIFYKKHFRLNSFYDWMMNMGIKLVHQTKSFQIKNKTKPVIQPRNILYIGSENRVYEALRKIYPNAEIHLFAVCNTRVISRYDDLEKIKYMLTDKHIDEIVFDNHSNSFSKIIFYMTALKNKGIRFKIHPKNTDFIIGSDDKNGMGEVVILP